MSKFYISLIFLFVLSAGYADEWLEHTIDQVESSIETANRLLSPAISQCSVQDERNSYDLSEEIKDWNRAGFSSTEITFLRENEIYPTPSEREFTHAIDLNLVQFENNGWQRDQIIESIQRTAQIYAQCGIKVEQAKLIETTAIENKVDISFNLNDDARLASMAPTDARPLVFYIRSNSENENAFAWPRRMAPLPRLNTAFITANVNNTQYDELRNDGYSATAHELAHLYCDCPHDESDEKNLLASNVENLSRDLSPVQCQIFKLSPLLRKL